MSVKLGVGPVKLYIASPVEVHSFLIKVDSPEKGRSVPLLSITERSSAESALYLEVSKFKPALVLVPLFYPTSRKLITLS